MSSHLYKDQIKRMRKASKTSLVVANSTFNISTYGSNCMRLVSTGTLLVSLLFCTEWTGRATGKGSSSGLACIRVKGNSAVKSLESSTTKCKMRTLLLQTDFRIHRGSQEALRNNKRLPKQPPFPNLSVKTRRTKAKLNTNDNDDGSDLPSKRS